MLCASSESCASGLCERFDISLCLRASVLVCDVRACRRVAAGRLGRVQVWGYKSVYFDHFHGSVKVPASTLLKPPVSSSREAPPWWRLANGVPPAEQVAGAGDPEVRGQTTLGAGTSLQPRDAKRAGCVHCQASVVEGGFM